MANLRYLEPEEVYSLLEIIPTPFTYRFEKQGATSGNGRVRDQTRGDN